MMMIMMAMAMMTIIALVIMIAVAIVIQSAPCPCGRTDSRSRPPSTPDHHQRIQSGCQSPTVPITPSRRAERRAAQSQPDTTSKSAHQYGTTGSNNCNDSEYKYGGNSNSNSNRL